MLMGAGKGFSSSPGVILISVSAHATSIKQHEAPESNNDLPLCPSVCYLLLREVILPPSQEPDERIEAALQRQLAVQVRPRVPLPRRVSRVAPLLQLLGDRRHADVHAVQLGDAVGVVDVHVDGQPAADKG